MVLLNSTVSDNVAGEFGGGIFSFGVLTIENSTISHNIAGRSGGGVWVQNQSPGYIVNSTFSGNSAGADGGGILNTGPEPLTITSSTQSGRRRRRRRLYELRPWQLDDAAQYHCRGEHSRNGWFPDAQ